MSVPRPYRIEYEEWSTFGVWVPRKESFASRITREEKASLLRYLASKDPPQVRNVRTWDATR